RAAARKRGALSARAALRRESEPEQLPAFPLHAIADLQVVDALEVELAKAPVVEAHADVEHLVFTPAAALDRIARDTAADRAGHRAGGGGERTGRHVELLRERPAVGTPRRARSPWSGALHGARIGPPPMVL